MPSCGDCKFMMPSHEQPPEQQCCCHAPNNMPGMPRWPVVTPFHWCGEWAAIGAGVANQYIHGTAALVDETPVGSLTRDGPTQFNVVAMRSCQVTNTASKDDVIVSFLNGNNPNDVIGFVSCPQHDTREFTFTPGLRADIGNSI